mgnify:CR=1 FL=1
MHAPPDLIVSGLALDSRKVEEGFLFFALPGEKEDGGEFIAEAKARGAACAVCEHPPETEIPYILVPDAHKALALCAAVWYGTPAGKLTVVGVTGTNGKTTTTYLIKQLLERTKGAKVGLIGTNQNLISDKTIPTDRTTPDALTVQRLFAQMVDAGCTYAVMEVSSHALMQSRVEGIRFRVGVFTNLTQDHLDYHGTMEEYYLAKRMLADMSRTMVINIDDEYGRRTADYCRMSGIQAVTTSVNTSGADYFAEFIRLHPHGAEFLLTCPEKQKSWVAKIPLTGLYNVSNAVQAAVMCRMMGFPMEDVLAALEKSPGVSGRLETIYQGKFTVIRDYAHTGDGLEKLLSTLRPLTKRLTAVFGAAGERDSSKRPEMGRIAAKYADRLIITTDNPRHEPQQQTIDDVRRGVPAAKECEEFVDRKAAIYRALETAQPGELIALCGKGHEDYQAIGDENIPFNEREIVLDWLKSRGII